MSNKKRMDMEINFIYNSNALQEREALGYIKSLGNHKINETDVYNNALTERMLADIARELNVMVSDLLDPENDKYKDELKDADFEDNDILKMICEDFSLLRTPIMLFKEGAKFVKSPYDTNSIDMALEDIQSTMANSDEK
jgi:arsenate reductase-like glutaredoxin family protein